MADPPATAGGTDCIQENVLTLRIFPTRLRKAETPSAAFSFGNVVCTKVRISGESCQYRNAVASGRRSATMRCGNDAKPPTRRYRVTVLTSIRLSPLCKASQPEQTNIRSNIATRCHRRIHSWSFKQFQTIKIISSDPLSAVALVP